MLLLLLLLRCGSRGQSGMQRLRPAPCHTVHLRHAALVPRRHGAQLLQRINHLRAHMKRDTVSGAGPATRSQWGHTRALHRAVDMPLRCTNVQMSQPLHAHQCTYTWLRVCRQEQQAGEAATFSQLGS
jgi:hypothetical protein